MGNYTIVLFILALIILLTAVAEKLHWASAILLILAGAALSFVPNIAPPHIEPDVIFLLFLPPLLYDAAFKIPQREFKEQFSTISSLAFGLVFITTVGIAVLSRYLIPGMTWPLSFLLGAILAATDAVAAIGITKNLGLSSKTTVILEGESLLNDASALLAYRLALASVMGAGFVWWKAGLTFLLLVSGGIVVGFVSAQVFTFLLRIVRGNATAVNSFILLSPFVTYLAAEELDVSGVIAVVVLGIHISRMSKLHFTEKIQAQSQNIWEIITFLLNGLVFILIGLQLKSLLNNLTQKEVWLYSGYALAILLLAIFIRTIRVFMKKNALERVFTSPNNNKRRRTKILENSLINFQESLVISWSGMRGIVSLAIALALPQTLSNGEPFPMRNAILFISFMVILFSILGQGLLLPYIIKYTDKRAKRVSSKAA